MVLTYQRGGSCTCPWRPLYCRKSGWGENRNWPRLYSIDWNSRAPQPQHTNLYWEDIWSSSTLLKTGPGEAQEKWEGHLAGGGEETVKTLACCLLLTLGPEVTSLCPAHHDNGLSGSYSSGTQKHRQCGEQKKIKTNAPSEMRDHKNEVLLFKRNMRRF